MIDQVKKWFLMDEAASDIQALSDWSRRQGWGFHRAPTGEGFTVEARSDENRWSVEWGPSERSYILGSELRLRIDLGLPPDLQLLVMNRALAESLETEAFEQCIQNLQTVIDSSMPEEMRWLSMFPMVNLATLEGVEPFYSAWSIAPSLALWWIDGELGQALIDLLRGGLPEYTPFVLMTLRGRLYLRAQLPAPALDLIIQLQRVFLTAAEQATRVASMAPLDLSKPMALNSAPLRLGGWTFGRQADANEA